MTCTAAILLQFVARGVRFRRYAHEFLASYSEARGQDEARLSRHYFSQAAMPLNSRSFLVRCLNQLGGSASNPLKRLFPRSFFL